MRVTWAGGARRAKVSIGPRADRAAAALPRGTTLERVLAEETGAKTSRGAVFGTDGGGLRARESPR